jgi:hypothetical protein
MLKGNEWDVQWLLTDTREKSSLMMQIASDAFPIRSRCFLRNS